MARVEERVVVSQTRGDELDGIWLILCRWALLSPLAGAAIFSARAQDPLPTINLQETDRISIFAEKAGQRNYAERFAESVYEAAYATTGESAGKGLVIMGNFDQPHPIVLVKQYMDIADSTEGLVNGPLFESIMGKAIKDWEEADQSMQDEIGVDIESIAYVIPMPLQPALLNLYLAAREEGFDEAKVAERYSTLKPMEVRFGDFEQYGWVIYLPPKNAIDRAIKDVLPNVMKKEKMGFFKRSMVKGAVFTFKPVIRDAMEGVRKSLLYESILKATSDLGEEDIEELKGAYMGALMPRGRVISRDKDKKSVKAVEAKLAEIKQYQSNPYVAPTEVLEDLPETIASLVGDYRGKEDGRLNVFIEDDQLFMKEYNRDAVRLWAVSDSLFTTEDRQKTIEFVVEDDGSCREGTLRGPRLRMSIYRRD